MGGKGGDEGEGRRESKLSPRSWAEESYQVGLEQGRPSPAEEGPDVLQITAPWGWLSLSDNYDKKGT